MKNFFAMLAVLLLPCQLTFAADQPVSAASVDQLMEITQAHKMMDDYSAQIEVAMRNGMKQAFGNEKPSAEQQQLMDTMATRMVAIFKEELSWESMKPSLIELYRKTFSQGEVDGMLAFYRSKAGQAMIARMPQVQQYSMQLGQERAAHMLPRLQQLAKDLQEQAKAADKSAPAPAPVPADKPSPAP
jgi:hypothetical protein